MQKVIGERFRDFNCVISFNFFLSFLFYSQSSNLLNQARLRVLKARDEHKDNVLNDAKIQLGNITRDQQKYSNLLSGLIAQVRKKSYIIFLC